MRLRCKHESIEREHIIGRKNKIEIFQRFCQEKRLHRIVPIILNVLQICTYDNTDTNASMKNINDENKTREGVRRGRREDTDLFYRFDIFSHLLILCNSFDVVEARIGCGSATVGLQCLENAPCPISILSIRCDTIEIEETLFFRYICNRNNNNNNAHNNIFTHK